MGKKAKRNFLILSWALYDLANQFFALNVISLYFPRWLTVEKSSPEILYSLSFGISMLFVAFCAPFLGAISDVTAGRKKFLAYFTFLSVIFTIALGFAPNIILALIFFAIANFGCQEAVIFYNALMVNVAPKGRIGFVSGLGRMFGYTGAIIALYLTKPVILEVGYQATFILTGIAFLIFSLPCLIFIKEEPSGDKIRLVDFLNRQRLLQVFRRLKETLFGRHKSRQLTKVLKAAFFGLCVVNAITLFMAVYASKVFGLDEAQIINLIAVSTVFAIGASIFSGIISDKIGYRRSLMGVFCLWGVCLAGAGILNPPFHWLIGALAGVSLGSTWVVFRALVVNLAPRQKIGEAFGLFNMVGYLAGIVGPLFWGLAVLSFSFLGQGGYRLTCLGLILFLAVGMRFLLIMEKDSSPAR